MKDLGRRFADTHLFLRQQSFYPVLLSTLLVPALSFGRRYLLNAELYAFLLWNVLLAWIPYLCALVIAYTENRRGTVWHYVAPAALWLLFFPNAAYLVTDLYNLTPAPPVPLWYDVCLFVACAWTGLLLAVASLQILQRAVRRRWGNEVSWVFVVIVAALNGVGIYLGRILRWNSWDVFVDPIGVLTDAVMPLLHPIAHRQSLAVIVTFSALLFVCYVSLVAFQQRETVLSDRGDRHTTRSTK